MNIYWLIAFLPSWVIFALVGLGAIGLFAAMFIGKIPFIQQYNLPIKIISILLLMSGIYLQGALAYKESTDKAVSDLKVKLAQAEAKSAKTNVVIVEKIVEDTKIIHTKGKTITDYIDREVVKHDQDCTLPSEVIRAHNAAVTLDTTKLDGDKKWKD